MEPQRPSSASPPILWLASYPKSGNTWLRFLLHAALLGAPKDSIQVATSIPDIHRPLPTDQQPAFGGLLPVKTHFKLTEKHPLLDRTAKAVYVLRHPKDVLLSGLNYTRLATPSGNSADPAAYTQAFIRHGGDPGFESQGFGTWANHARSWAKAEFPVHTIRYEDLQTEPAEALRAVLKFLGCTISDEAVHAAVKASSFDQLRALEVREKNDRKKQSLEKRLFVGDQAAARKGALFMNSGRSGQSLGSIGPGLDEAFDEAFAEALCEFGYGST